MLTPWISVMPASAGGVKMIRVLVNCARIRAAPASTPAEMSAGSHSNNGDWEILRQLLRCMKKMTAATVTVRVSGIATSDI